MHLHSFHSIWLQYTKIYKTEAEITCQLFSISLLKKYHRNFTLIWCSAIAGTVKKLSNLTIPFIKQLFWYIFNLTVNFEGKVQTLFNSYPNVLNQNSSFMASYMYAFELHTFLFTTSFELLLTNFGPRAVDRTARVVSFVESCLKFTTGYSVC